MPECQYCSAELNDRYNFCVNCTRQVRCLTCGEMLERDKRICLVCGQPLVAAMEEQEQLNEFTFEENQTDNSAHRVVKGRFSDSAVQHVTMLFGGLTRSRPAVPHAPVHQQPALTTIGSTEEQVPEQTTEFSDQRDQDTSRDTRVVEEQDDSDRNKALKFFRAHGENEIIPTEVDYAGQSWKEQQRRFIILYVWAYNEIVGHPVPSKANVTEASKRVKVYDANNTHRYYAELANEYLLSTDQGLELNTRGIQLVKGVLAEMEGTSEGEGYVYWKAATKPAAGRSRVSKGDVQLITEWAEKSVDVGDFDTRSLNTSTEWAMFALWSITKRLDAARAVKPSLAYQYLLKRYAAVPVKQNAFSEALRRRGNTNKFQRTPEKEYYLTKQGQQEVESWIDKGTVRNSET